MDAQDYLGRINFKKNIQINSDTLRELQLAHLKTIPFENLDIGLGRKIKLDLSSLWDKIIINRRGGFCYELNGLFGWLLNEIGFDVTYLNAVMYYEEEDRFGIEFDHLALLVKTKEDNRKWLVDVGFGDTFTMPLEIHHENEQKQGLRSYWVKSFKRGLMVWQKNYDGKMESQYVFDLIPHLFPNEYLEGCLYHQTSPDSFFMKGKIISRLTENGRVSLQGNTLVVTVNGERTFTEVNETQWKALLKEHFDVVL